VVSDFSVVVMACLILLRLRGLKGVEQATRL